MISIRQAVETDVEALCSLDLIARQRNDRREFIRREVAAGTLPNPEAVHFNKLSNLPMQSLLAKLGYVLSGVIHILDDGNPKIVYFKRLR